MMKGKVVFTGNFWNYLGISIALLLGIVVTFGLLLPYYIYWQFKYFFTNMELEVYDTRGVQQSTYVVPEIKMNSDTQDNRRVGTHQYEHEHIS